MSEPFVPPGPLRQCPHCHGDLTPGAPVGGGRPAGFADDPLRPGGLRWWHLLLAGLVAALGVFLATQVMSHPPEPLPDAPAE